MDYRELPGEDLIEKGLSDLRLGDETIESLLVLVGAPRLREVGIDVPDNQTEGRPEHRLYELLSREHGDAAHSRYNSLLRRLISFERAAACAKR